MAGTGSLEEILSSCLSPENLRRVQAESALKVLHAFPLAHDFTHISPNSHMSAAC